MMNSVALLHQAADCGLTIRAKGGALLVHPASRCPTAFASTLRANKPDLLALLGLDFIIVESAALDETIYFVGDEETKTGLVEAGAEEGCVYTRLELRTLVELHRRSPITTADLLRIHEAKCIFCGRIEPTQ